MLESPRQILARYERGELEREEMHALMALHARALVREMEEDSLNPAAAWVENLRARRAAGQLVRRHGSRLVREVLAALAEVDGFPPANLLWNAEHPDVPLHCFLRIRREPVFRILSFEVKGGGEVRVMVEFGPAAKGQGTRRSFVLRRAPDWKLAAEAI